LFKAHSCNFQAAIKGLGLFEDILVNYNREDQGVAEHGQEGLNVADLDDGKPVICIRRWKANRRQ